MFPDIEEQCVVLARLDRAMADEIRRVGGLSLPGGEIEAERGNSDRQVSIEPAQQRQLRCRGIDDHRIGKCADRADAAPVPPGLRRAGELREIHRDQIVDQADEPCA
jgi:hypothetical protein